MEEIGIESTYVELIKNGAITTIARLGKPQVLRVKEDDTVSIREDFWYEGTVLESLSHAAEIKITQILYFESLTEMFTTTDFESAVPTATSVDEAVTKYREFYSAADETEYGIVALSFEIKA
jgi:ASC-1-like (ASCH) protein